MNKFYRWLLQKDIDSSDWGYGMPIIAPIVWAIIVGIGHVLYFIEQKFTR